MDKRKEKLKKEILTLIGDYAELCIMLDRATEETYKKLEKETTSLYMNITIKLDKLKD
jgi:hypothetical protein